MLDMIYPSCNSCNEIHSKPYLHRPQFPISHIVTKFSTDSHSKNLMPFFETIKSQPVFIFKLLY